MYTNYSGIIHHHLLVAVELLLTTSLKLKNTNLHSCLVMCTSVYAFLEKYLLDYFTFFSKITEVLASRLLGYTRPLRVERCVARVHLNTAQLPDSLCFHLSKL